MHKIIPKLLRKLKAIFAACKEKINHVSATDICEMSEGVRLIGNASIKNFHGEKGDIKIGRNTVILGELCIFCEGAKICVGEYSYIGPNSNIWAFSEILIGSRVQISYDVNIHDSNSHSISGKERYMHAQANLNSGHPRNIDIPKARIAIEDDVWIGFGAIILKGVTIGKGAIIGAGAIITKDVEPMAIVVGNPQRVVGKALP